MYLVGLHIYFKMIHGPFNVKLLEDLKKKRGYCKLKKEVTDRMFWRTRFGIDNRTPVRKTTLWMIVPFALPFRLIYITFHQAQYLFIFRAVYSACIFCGSRYLSRLRSAELDMAYRMSRSLTKVMKAIHNLVETKRITERYLIGEILTSEPWRTDVI